MIYRPYVSDNELFFQEMGDANQVFSGIGATHRVFARQL